MSSSGRASRRRHASRVSGPQGAALDAFECVQLMAHDIQSPLAVLTSSAELLTESQTEEDKQYLTSLIQRQSLRLKGLLQNLIDYPILEAGLVSVAPQLFDMAELVRQTCADLESLCPHRITVEVPARPCMVLGDGEKLRRVIENLVGNALRYTPKDGSVMVRLRPAASWTRLEVEDEGPGIEACDWPRVFEPFVRLNSDGAGRGLGLYIVKQLSEAHGGRVAVENGKKGARFIVEIPAAEEGSDPARAETEESLLQRAANGHVALGPEAKEAPAAAP